LVRSKEEYYIRVGLIILLNFYVEEEYLSQMFKILDEIKFQEAINKLQSYSCLENITTDDSVLSGSVKSNGGTLFISIPYLDTFKIYVDGEKVDYYKIFDTFIGIDIPEGEHNVVIKYIPKGFIFGMILSLIGLLITLVYFKLKKCNIKV